MRFYIINIDRMTEGYVEAIREAGSKGRIELEDILVSNDGPEFFVRYLSGVSNKDLATDDQFIPSHGAPHVLAHAIIRLLKRSGFKWSMIDFPGDVGTPYEMDMEKGLRAVSFTLEKCPEDCTEPKDCPTKRSKLSWNIGKKLKDYSKKRKLRFIGFECAHFINSVSTIPMKAVIKGWLELKKDLASRKKARFIIATHSKCHGIAALIEVQKM